MTFRTFVTVALMAALAATSVADATAAPARRKAIWGPASVDGRSQFPIYRRLGVGIWQSTLRWDDVAPQRPADPSDPDDPAYHWPAELDVAVREARRYGIQVNLMLIGAPRWANGDKPWNWAPRHPRDFARFAAAAAKRYRSVRYWMIWGEPSKAANFQPLVPDHGRPLRGRRELRGPRLYARILDRSYVALKRVSRRNTVIGGNTYTVGTVAPIHYLRALKLPGGRRPRMDLWGHNAFSARKPRLNAPRLSNGYSDFSDLDNLARQLDKAFKRAPLKRQRHLKIFISEFTVPTDHRNWEFNFYTDRATQARWIRAALRIARTYRRIYTFGYLSLYDDPLRPAGDQVERGLMTRHGEEKPAFAAYRKG